MFLRTKLLIGEDGVERLKNSKVIVFGVGGVGGYVVESLVRAGLGEICIVDKDVFDITNLNRQILATRETIGRSKVEVAKERILSINPECKVRACQCFYLPDDPAVTEMFDFKEYDYVVDAVDNVSAKIEIITRAKEAGTKVISSMGTGNKLDPLAFKIADIEKTEVCPLAKVCRKELRKRGIKDVKVLYSTEPAIKTGADVVGSISFVPSVAGLLIGGEVIKDLVATPLDKEKNNG